MLFFLPFRKLRTEYVVKEDFSRQKKKRNYNEWNKSSICKTKTTTLVSYQ